MTKLHRLHLVFVLLWGLASCDQQHLVCKTIQDVLTENGGSESSQRLSCPQTGVGPSGIQGLRGPPGYPAVVDYGRVNKVISNNVASALANLESRASELERNVKNLEECRISELRKNVTILTTEQGKSRCKRWDGFYYQGKCYTVSTISPKSHMDYFEAVAECAKTGALLAELRDKTEQRVLHDFVYSKFQPGQSSADIWLGLKYLSDRSTFLYRSRLEIPITKFKWRKGYPWLSSRYIFAKVASSTTSLILWNRDRTEVAEGVLCEKDVTRHE